MSFVVARMQKMKSGNLVGVGNHNQRNTDNHSNKDIDVERSYLNYDLVNRTENYKRDIEQFINDNKSSSRAVRKDAVLINEWIITSDNQFFKDLKQKRAPIKRPNRFGISNQLIPFCTPANHSNIDIIAYFFYGTIIKHSETTNL